MKKVLTILGCIFILLSLFLPFELQQGYSGISVIFSLLSLLTSAVSNRLNPYESVDIPILLIFTIIPIASVITLVFLLSFSVINKKIIKLKIFTILVCLTQFSLFLIYYMNAFSIFYSPAVYTFIIGMLFVGLSYLVKD